MPPRLIKKSALGIGLALTLLQLGLALKIAPDKRMTQAYQRLCVWDCRWYESIALNGYRSTVPPVRQNQKVSNVAFFPAYPLMARLLYRALGVQPKIGLLVIAQVSCVFFWTILWTWLKRWRIPTGYSLLVVLAVLAHPASFFLVSGYSESLFLASLLLFMLAGARRLSIPAGLTLSLTRIVGVLGATYPIVQCAAHSTKQRRIPSAKELKSVLLRATPAIVGTLLFLIYCKVRFGRFDLYLETQRIGWGIVPDYLAIFKWKQFRYQFPIDEFTTRSTMVYFSVFAMVEATLLGTGQATYLSRRLPLYVVSFAIFYITLSGLKSVNFLSMIRYSLPWYVLLILCVAHLTQHLPRLPRPLEVGVSFFLAFVCFKLLVYFQIPALRDFLLGRWFA